MANHLGTADLDIGRSTERGNCFRVTGHPSRLILRLMFISCLFATTLLAGCASTGGSVDIVKKLDVHDRLASPDIVQVNVHPASGVSMGNLDAQRLSDVIKSKVNQKKVSNPSSGQPRNFELDVTITRYEKGSAFARLILVGLGQIHIDGRILLKDTSTGRVCCEFLEDKTFAWGGLYGGITRIEDVEEGFAEAIATQVVAPK